MITIRQCDLLNCNAEYICHQVNCKGAMGAGLAKAIANKWPFVKLSYESFCDAYKHNPKSLLGVYQVVNVAPNKNVINIFGQLDYGREFGRCYTSYDALMQAFKNMEEWIDVSSTIAFPYRFGCGLAGGDWEVVFALLKIYLNKHNIIICKKD